MTTPTGRSAGLSMAEFNARAKRIAASTATIERGEPRRPSPSRFRKAAPPSKAESNDQS